MWHVLLALKIGNYSLLAAVSCFGNWILLFRLSALFRPQTALSFDSRLFNLLFFLFQQVRLAENIGLAVILGKCFLFGNILKEFGLGFQEN